MIEPGSSSAPSILVVDDDPLVLSTMDTVLRRAGYRTVPVTDPHRARALCNVECFDAIVTDLDLPMGDGRFLAQTLASESTQPVVVVTGIDSLNDAMRMLGGTPPRAIVPKPFGGQELVKTIADVLRGVAAPLDDDPRTTCELARGMARALALRDVETEAHAQRVALWTSMVARTIGMDARAVFWAQIGALLHDVGKIGVPDSILKKPASLDASEWELMRKHPELGVELLAPVPRLAGARPVVLSHHESWDGTGYPHRLAGEAIPLAARVFSPVDAYDAMTSDRPYRRGMSHEEAIARIVSMKGKQFDPAVVDAIVSFDVARWLEIRAEVADGATVAPP